jgi:hypothetical protein
MMGVLLVGSLLLASGRIEATSVVALIDRSNHRLIIAADCRVNRESSSISECKIIEESNCVAAVAGLYVEPSAQFDLRKLVFDACREAGDLRVKADAFLREAKVPYEKAVELTRKADPIYFHEILENKSTEVIFAGLQKGQLALFVRGLLADSTGRVTIERYESLDAPSSPLGYFCGLNDHIKAYVQSHNGWKANYPRAAVQFVEMEIKAHPHLAGPPISEVEIDSEGRVNWLSRGACGKRQHDKREPTDLPSP